MVRFASHTLTALIFILVLAASVHAQASRTWVSGVGDDVNPCSRTAPCKTFAGAISKTAAGGEINALDPAGFGAVTITKAMTINGGGSLSGLLTPSTNGVIVNAGSGDVVILRNLSLNGFGSGTNGVRFIAGGLLIVEDCTIQQYMNSGIDMSLTGSGGLIVRNTSITGTGTVSVGVTVNSSSGVVAATLDHVLISRTNTGVNGKYGATDVYNSVVTQNSSFGVLAEGTGIVSIENTALTSNGVAMQANPGAVIRTSNNEIHDNLTGFGCGGGTVASAGNNRKAGNSGGGPVCAPNAGINLQ